MVNQFCVVFTFQLAPMRVLRFDGDLLRNTVNEIVKITELKGITWHRFTELNRLMKGLRSHEMTIISGRTGIGKTTFACEYSLDLAEQGVPTLWGSFEMPLRKICRTLLQHEPLHGLTTEQVVSWAELFSSNIPMFFINTCDVHSESDIIKI
ncbi:unnamed protein product [Protopolystoma xenopodis]|uniref:SF4 helicase domain-containing protein n=1 Tax=Protopolystoma xenopodis TaxID=117903 RepID=A0A448X6X6_9PLAT|nr:unnamed protein product [Protopolystoma xenopodis]